ncbi:MAG: hypothetical protein AAFR17_16145, partial [Pseudomonadota bacterium]
METSLPPLRIGVLTDGRAGNVAQAMALAEAIGRLRAVEIAEAAVEGGGRLPALLGHGLYRTGLRAVAPVFPRGWPELLIGAGRRGAPLLAAGHAVAASSMVRGVSRPIAPIVPM